MYLEIITPDKKVFEGEVESVKFPGVKGSFQVLENHAPLISALTKGDVSYKKKNEEFKVTIEGGVVEVLFNNIVVLAESASNVF
jgi:F-type H+-transporting ATPase subunit epsilon